jgi:16S rRNA (cytosine1402-N4)-methyltransferase
MTGSLLMTSVPSPPSHQPVLLERVLDLLGPCLARPDSVLVDATLGLGGHSEAVLERFPGAAVIGIDRDPDALALASARLRGFGDRFVARRATYDQLGDVIEGLGRSRVDAVLFDLGVSSMQLDVLERGFAYRVDSPLDMRMDPSTGQSAADILNTYSATQLTRVLREYGEEKFARRIADAVLRARGVEPFTTSGRLVELLYDAIPAPARRTGGHPAKRTFQALRMEVNDELAVLRTAVPAALAAISIGGRVVVESYHSLEDRIVKRAFVDASRSTVPVDLPFVPEGMEPAFRLVTRGAEQADADEIAANPRAASVRLRAIERIRDGGAR